MPEPLRSPFIYPGGKSAVANAIWRRFGRVAHYLEPFCGSAAVLLARPDWTPGMVETVNDACGFIVNAYRAIQLAPEETVRWVDAPVHEVTLHAVEAWLLGQRSELVERLEGNPDYCDLGEADHEFPAGWEHFKWKANGGGYGNQGQGRRRENARRETIHFNKFCIRPELDLIHALEVTTDGR